MPPARGSFQLGETIVLPGETRHVRLPVSESYVSTLVEIPVTVINGLQEGPVLLVTAASHGDECNGTAIVRELIYGVDHSTLRGVLVCAPVLNLPGFLRNERNLPDGRDLNRNFPGKPDGNSAQRIAHMIFNKIVLKCNYGIDLHTAGRGRSNILQVRGDMTNPEVRRIAKAFGTEIVIDEPGLDGTLRRAATEAGVPTITAEVGESQRFERPLVRAGLKGVMNVLYELGMLKGKVQPPLFQVIVKKTEWVRADRGGILEMYTKPRALLMEGEEVCAITNPFGKEVSVVRAPFTGMVVGITNYPMVSPGFPICHMVKLDKTLATVENALRRERTMKRGERPPEPLGEGAGREEVVEESSALGEENAKGAGAQSEEAPSASKERVQIGGDEKIGGRIERIKTMRGEEQSGMGAGDAEKGGMGVGPREEGAGAGRAEGEERGTARGEARATSVRGEGSEAGESAEREQDREGSSTEYYEDYDEDAEPEEKE
ncbi:MAG: succinylglutamate desuccinylase/aspartoacylase family protein [Thermoplasmata archaeon]